MREKTLQFSIFSRHFFLHLYRILYIYIYIYICLTSIYYSLLCCSVGARTRIQADGIYQLVHLRGPGPERAAVAR